MVVIALVAAPVAWAGPSTTPKCAQTEYRQSHLAECNRSGVGAPGSFPGGGAAGGGGGLLGAIGRVVGGLGGLL